MPINACKSQSLTYVTLFRTEYQRRSEYARFMSRNGPYEIRGENSIFEHPELLDEQFLNLRVAVEVLGINIDLNVIMHC